MPNIPKYRHYQPTHEHCKPLMGNLKQLIPLVCQAERERERERERKKDREIKGEWKCMTLMERENKGRWKKDKE